MDRGRWLFACYLYWIDEDVYNNRHYLYDVITGAGVGILSVGIAYWLYPPLQRGLFGKEDNGCSITAVPYFDEVSSSAGFGCVVTF